MRRLERLLEGARLYRAGRRFGVIGSDQRGSFTAGRLPRVFRSERRRQLKPRLGVLINAGFVSITARVSSARYHRWGRALTLVPLLMLLSCHAGVGAAEPPFGFESRTVVTVYGDPTDLAWLGDDMLIATENGWLFLLKSQTPPGGPAGTATMILDLSDQIGQGREQGLLGVVADPDFPDQPYVYVYYTRAQESGHCLDLPANCFNRVSRFTMGDDGLLDPDSELPLLDSIMVGVLHNAGDLAFDAAKLLYVSTGDAGHWQDSQDLHNLNGKILRITRDGSPAAGNPFASPQSVACDTRGPGESTDPCPEIFAFGLRNPFRIAFNPNPGPPFFYINDVGQEGWEEIDDGIAGADYGWPLREGPCPVGMRLPCEPGTGFAEPIFAYPHESGCFSITGGAFVPDASPWGTTFQQQYLFADWGCGRIFLLSEGADGQMMVSRFAEDIPAITTLLMSPDGSTVYFAYGGGELDGRVGAIWHCSGRPLYGSWPPACLWGSSTHRASGSG